ncbi:hypothetical protein RND71_015915 [Anisodus tanguticus]|uniref:Uncharacterized protein n=1 Tax=Anisodus tanguticus TaxID=243964 RepID=A0AAE1S7H5_9SOLA|nr:hypothetical protein RND71_015915 [Anisodus tanguticus]
MSEKIAKQNEKYQAQANKHRKFYEFKEGDRSRFIFERSLSREENLLSSSLEVMDHSKFSNALVKMPTRLNYQVSMRFRNFQSLRSFSLLW